MLLNFFKTLTTLIDVIFPPRADAALVASATTANLMQLVHYQITYGVRTLLPFSTPLVRACIHEVKFHKNQQAITLLSAVLAATLIKQSQPTVLIPIPLSHKRLRDRGYNQSALLAKAAAAGLTNVLIAEDILLRPRDTVPQTSLNKADRLKNMQGAFVVNEAALASYDSKQREVIIFDDVCTTGATLQAAKAALTPHISAPITLLALAH